MGRPKIKTDAEIADTKRKRLDRLNERRRKRYAKDRGYRQEKKSAARITARNYSNNPHPELNRRAVCRLSISNIYQYCSSRKIVVNKVATEDCEPGLTSVELAPLIGLAHPVMLHKWHRSGKFPRPKLIALVGRTHAGIYTVDQALKLIQIMFEHYEIKSYFYKSDQPTIDRLYKVMK